MNLALEDGAVHDAEHALYLLAGFRYFLPVVASEPIRWRISMLVLSGPGLRTFGQWDRI